MLGLYALLYSSTVGIQATLGLLEHVPHQQTTITDVN